MPAKDDQGVMPEVKFKFGGDGFTAQPSQTVDLDSFLGDDPDSIEKIPEAKPATPKAKKPVAKAEGDEDEEDEELDLAGKKKPEATTQVTSDDILGTDEDDEEDELTPDVLKSKKPEVEVKKEEETEESQYALLTKDLLNLGVFTPDEDEEGNQILPEIKSGEDFLKTFQLEVKKQTGASIEKYLERFGPEYSDMFEAVYVNGVPPYEYISRQAKIEHIEDYDITSEENQEKIVRQWYKLEGRSPETIESKIQKLKNYEDLEEEAKEAQKVLVAKEQKSLQDLALQKQQELQRNQRIKADYTSSVGRIINERFKAKEFDGIPIDKKFAEQTYSYLTKDMYESKDKKQTLTEFDKDILELSRPENHANKVKIAMLLQMLKADPTLSKLTKKVISKESNALFNEVSKKFGKAKASTKQQEESSSFSNW